MTHLEESRRIWKPGLDEGGGVEDDVASGAGSEKGAVVGHVPVGKLQRAAAGFCGGRRR